MMTAAMQTGSASDPAAGAALGKSNILAVASGKGGVGMTWFSITLAHALARAGHRTLLFDGDLGLANIDVQLGVTPRRDLGSVIAGQTTMAQAVGHYAEGGFDIIAGRSGSGNLATLPPTRLIAPRTEMHAIAQGYGPLAAPTPTRRAMTRRSPAGPPPRAAGGCGSAGGARRWRGRPSPSCGGRHPGRRATRRSSFSRDLRTSWRRLPPRVRSPAQSS